jgi:putative MATE family efflux protein
MMARQGQRAGGFDLTQGPISRTLMMFALPTLGSNILQSLNGSINSVWIGRLIGEDALAASANANLIMFLMFSLGFGFGMAATILVGQSMGKRDIVGARRAFGTGIGLFAIVSILIGAFGWFASPWLLHMLGTPAASAPYALAYLRVIFLAMPPMFLGLMISMALRGVGDSMTPFYFMIANVVIDAGLNPFFIRGFGPIPAMGIAGSALTTLIANYVVLIGVTIYIYARNLPIALKGAELRFLIPDPKLLKVIAAKGFPMGLQMLVMTFSGIFMIGLVNRQGVETTAAYGVAQQLWTYVQMPAMAVGTAVSAMAAQNIGAKRWDRVGKITRSGLIINTLLTGSVVALLLLFDVPAFALFVGANSPAIPIARHIHLIATWSFILFGITMVLFSTIRANGIVVAPLLILTFGVLIARVGFAWSLLDTFGPDVLWWSFPAGSTLTLTLAVLYYRFGNWRGETLVSETVAEEARETIMSESEPGGRLNPAG